MAALLSELVSSMCEDAVCLNCWLTAVIGLLAWRIDLVETLAFESGEWSPAWPEEEDLGWWADVPLWFEVR